MSFRFLIMAMLLALSVASAPVQALPRLPELGGSSTNWLTVEQKVRIGHAWLRHMRQYMPVLNDPLVEQYTQNLVYRLASRAKLEYDELSVVVIGRSNINAFAVPGGVIGINAGVFLYAHSDDEVAAVLAHEIAHLSLNHFAHRQSQSAKISRAVLAAVLASIAAAVAGHAEAGMAGIAASQAAAIQSQLAFSRMQEREADRIGMQILVDAGFNPQAMPDFFQRLLQRTQFAEQPPSFLLTHPLTQDRVADARARAVQMKQPSMQVSRAFQLIQARLRAHFFADAQAAVEYFEARYQGGQSLEEQASGYGLALSLIRVKQFDRARKVLHDLIAIAPNQLWYRMALAEVASAANDFKAAIDKLHEVLAIMPGNYAASVLLARNLLRAGQLKNASALLNDLLVKWPHEPHLWQMLAKAQGRLNHRVRALRARGEYLFLTGRVDRAIQQLRYALHNSQDHFARHSRIEARLHEMKKLRRQTQQLL